jgi:hypothetical protein
MRDNKAPRQLGPRVASGVGLLLAIAAALSSPEGQPVGGLATRVWIPLPDWLAFGAAAAVSIASLIFIAMALGWRRSRQTDQDDHQQYRVAEKIPILLKVFLILVALAPGAMVGGAVFWLNQSDVSVVPAPLGSVDADRSDDSHGIEEPPAVPASSITTGLIGTLAVLSGIGSLGVVLWLCFGDRQRRRPGEFASGSGGQLAMAIEDSLDDLRGVSDARVAIIKIYGNFERALAAAELPRQPSQTPMEFMRAVLGKLPVPIPAVRNLTDVFEVARFSQHPVGVKERDRAWLSLIEIRTALEAKEDRPNAAKP